MSNELIQKNAELGRFLFCERYTLQPVKNALYIAEGQDLKRGAVVDVNGVLVGTNSLIPYAVLENDCDTRAKGAFASVFVKGEFNFDKLFFADGLSKEELDNIVYNGSKVGIVIKPYNYSLDFSPKSDEYENIIPDDASEENKLATAADVEEVKSKVDTIDGVIPSGTSTTNKLVNENGLQDAIDNASESWSTGFTPKGESSVSDLNDLATQSNGDSYIVTDSGTLTDGSLAVVAGDQVAWDETNSVWYRLPQYALEKFGTNEIKNLSTTITAFRTGDVIPVDGPDGTAKMSKDTLLQLTSQNTLAGFAKFTDSDRVNQIVRELYIPAGVIADLTSVKFVRMYNGYGDFYGVQLEGTGGTMLLDLRTSTKSNPHLNGDAGAVVNYDLITDDYERIECNLNADIRDLAFSPSVKNAIQDAEIQANTNFYPALRFFSNREVSKYIKEIYIPSDVLSKAQVESVDSLVVHNSPGDMMGVSLKSGNTILLSITSATEKSSGYIKKNGGHIVFDFTGLSGNTTISTTLNISVQDINCSPTIAGLLLVFDANVKFTSSPEANKFLQQVYIPSDAIADLSTIVRIRVYNGFGGFYGLQLQATGGTILLSLRGTNKKAFYTDGTSGVVINWDYFDGDDYVEYDTSINGNAREMAYSPYIKAYMLNEQMNKVVTLFTDDDFLNSVIKELYIPSSVLSDAQVNSIDNYVLFRNGSLWGIVFKSSSSSVLELYSNQNLGSSIYARNGAYARYNLPTDGTSNLTGNAHLVLSKVRGVENSPAIYSYLLNEPNKIPKPWYENSQIVQDLSALNNQRAVVYQGDTKSDSNYVVNAVAYPDGSMIVCRRGGVVAKVATDGTETTLLTISHASDWRLCWMDKDLNVYVSPHSSVDNGGSNIDVSARGLYKLPYGESTFTKVINLYDPDSEVTTETQNNDDTIWTMCQDSEGNLYAGVYAHTIRANAGIYKSTDGGDTWTYIYNFVTSGDAPGGRHIHDIICNPYDNCLYVIVGEINQIFKSADGGSTWIKTNWILEKYKGTMLFPVPDGILAGSDGAYECIMSKIYSDGRVRTTSKTWAGTVFAFRKSDVSGAIYAFTKIDSSVNSTSYFPPVAAISDPSALQDWLDSDPANKAEWQAYNAFIAPRFPEDAIRPQHCAIFVSYDNGETWSIFKRFNVTSAGAFGFWTTGQFRNGECMTGYVGSSHAFVRPLVVTEGKHKFGSSGLDLEGDIFVKLNSSSVVAQL